MTFRNALLRVGRPISSLVGRLFFLFIAAGCTTLHVRTGSVPHAVTTPRVELASIAFFPQDDYQCGPAALATVLTSAGQSATPEQLAPQVYIAQRRGSLQLEMLAATRRNGAVAFLLDPQLGALLAELEAGHPVVVLQNLAFDWAPRWHYAVAIGYDLERNEIILRSGRNQRLVMPFGKFERTWNRSGNWAMVALPPGKDPAIAEETSYMNAIIAFEKISPPTEAARAYRAAIDRWPQNALAWMGLGNTSYLAQRWSESETAFRRSAQLAEDPAPALNNLAMALEAQGRYAEAVAAARLAVRAGGPFQSTAQSTLTRLLQEQTGIEK